MVKSRVWRKARVASIREKPTPTYGSKVQVYKIRIRAQKNQALQTRRKQRRRNSPVLIYLASPYSHPDKEKKEERYQEAIRLSHYFVAKGMCIFSPIVHNHPLALLGLPTNWEFWERYDREFLFRSTELFLALLPGWRESNGMKMEYEIAISHSIPVRVLHPTTFFLRSLSLYGRLSWEDVSSLLVD